MTEWNFLTKHGRVLLCIARDPNIRLRDIAGALEITERSAYSLVGELTNAGYVLKQREGRRNRYLIQRHLPIPGTTLGVPTLGEVLDVFVARESRRSA